MQKFAEWRSGGVWGGFLALTGVGREFSPQAFLVLLSRQKNARPAGHRELLIS